MAGRMLITGGAGFIGVNSAKHFADRGWKVTVLDNLSRRGAADNLSWIRGVAAVDFERADVRDEQTVAGIMRKLKPDVVLHLAGQVAVTTSVLNPREDFEINALGTLNILEAVRTESRDSFVINAATNKVYGSMKGVGVTERNGRYEYADLAGGVAETQPLDFHSPYGCSKGVADQYTIDYTRIYGLRATTFRQSCIYGTRQFGVEDQGWVAWFTIAAVLGRPVTIYGDGKQVRDVLHVADLAHAYEAAIENADAVSGQAFNIGGGPANTMSLLELLSHLEVRLGRTMEKKWDEWRPGDQPVFVCDIRKAHKLLNWRPSTTIEAGVDGLVDWVRDNTGLFSPGAGSFVRSV